MMNAKPCCQNNWSTKTNDIICDLAKEIPTLENIHVVIHAAGKAHVYPRTEAEIKEFF